MKKSLAPLTLLFFIFCALLFCFGCDHAVTPEPTQTITPLITPTPVPSPTPEPTPVPQLVVVASQEDYDGLMLYLRTDTPQAFPGVPESRADSLGTLPQSDEVNTNTVVVILTDAWSAEEINALSQRGASIALLMKEGDTTDLPVFPLYYKSIPREQLPALILEELLNFPPHDTPVRLFGMFSGEDSPAKAAWEAGRAAGKIFARRTYIEGGEDMNKWVQDALDAYIAGTVDGVYCETDAMAEAMTAALAAAGRADMELFSCEAGRQYLALQKAFPSIAVCSLQVDLSPAYVYIASYIRREITGASSGAALEQPPLQEAFHYSKPIKP